MPTLPRKRRVTAKPCTRFAARSAWRQIGFGGHVCVSDRAPGLVARSKLHAAAQQDFLADGRAVAQLEAGVDQRIATHTAQHGLFRALGVFPPEFDSNRRSIA
jgi:hypothetical protein